jgi:hypothetical protein
LGLDATDDKLELDDREALLGDGLSKLHGGAMTRRISLANVNARHLRPLIGSGFGVVLLLAVTALLFVNLLWPVVLACVFRDLSIDSVNRRIASRWPP